MDDLSPLDSSLPSKPIRPAQHGMLALLPAELLIQTFNHLLDTGDSGWALALSSVAVRNAVIDIFYRRNGKEIFLKGLETADVGILRRCEKFGVASTKYVWEVPRQKDASKTFSRSMRPPYPGSIWRAGGQRRAAYHRPVDRLLESAFAGDVIEQKHYDALRWLVDRGHDASSSNERLPGKHMVRSLPSQLQKVRDRESMLMISKMIGLLSSRGFPTPATKFALNKLPGNELDPIPNYLISSGDYRGMASDLNETRGVKLGTKYLDPPVALDEYEGIRKPDPPYQFQGEGIDAWNPTAWWHTCRMEDLLGMLHGDRFGFWGWEESYIGEVDDIFSAKVALLTWYEAITEDERELLEAVIKAMKEITILRKLMPLTGLALQKASWEKLWTCVTPFFNMSFFNMSGTGLVDLQYEHRWENHDRKKLHRFAFKGSQPYNPWRAWYTQTELQKRRDAWGPMSAEAFEEALKKDEEWQHMWKMFRWSRGFKGDEDYDGKPRWYRVGMDEWLSTVERDYPPESDPSYDDYNWSGFFSRRGNMARCL
ncbi:uncharacterized protein NECHADRAFT_74145 [Fusarium vanettenii 77-13-4]|uniref:Uncharacterized protein n=1 Tax=Fusarium vanettenii (strain ATCC MYA-4622 / CBS 123669 / FGSC 9596 / NRRL 45880 / 77-13-4) TaxID=660122 RepID=C7YW12_FUSV7|nr:uncharacterized protein NECHADRAFT_74145 [Fusarium vanettenii 77-13-4]EEU44093.1 hypothetical protein NECHADRAFT_74145 [Fusarium vanettenii 77-13-4]